MQYTDLLVPESNEILCPGCRNFASAELYTHMHGRTGADPTRATVTHQLNSYSVLSYVVCSPMGKTATLLSILSGHFPGCSPANVLGEHSISASNITFLSYGSCNHKSHNSAWSITLNSLSNGLCTRSPQLQMA
ncbi:unnamed protein product, partial [Dicrocoelium dendriticum]